MRQPVELADDVGGRGELLLAAARRDFTALEAPAVAQLDLHAHFVPVLGSFCRDRRIGEHGDALGERDAPRVALGARLELLDEAVAFEKQRRDAERQIELRRRHAGRLVLPADMIRGDLRAVHDDALDIGGAEAVLRLERAQRIERRVIAADTGVELERHAHGLPRRAQPGREL